MMKKAIAVVFVSLVACDGETLDVGANPVEPSAKAVHVAAGTGHGCAILPDTTVACWGFNMYGQAGLSQEASRKTDDGYFYVCPPTRVAGLTGVVQISADWQTSYALTQSGEVYQWGAFRDPIQDLRGGVPSYVPAKIAGLDHVVEVRTGGDPTCARKDDGTVWCWGGNAYKNVGVSSPHDPSIEEVLHPTRVEGISDAVEIAVSDSTSCARHANGDVSCWGRVELTSGSRPDDPTPVRIPGVHRATQLALAQGSVFALLEDRTVMAWGANGDALHPGQEGGSPAEPVPSLKDVRAISAQYHNACAIVGDGAVWCWGQNNSGELGQGTTSAYDQPAGPTQAPGLMATEIAVGTWGSCAKRTTGDFTCFGQSDDGSLGTTVPGNLEAATPGAAVVLPE